MGAVACTSGGGGSTAGQPVDLPDANLIVALRPFDDCEGVLAYLKEQAALRVGPWGIPGLTPSGYGYAEGAGGEATAREEDAAPASPTTMLSEGTDGDQSGTGGGAGDGFSGTNVQEAGVDEPDLVKTDGQRIVAVAGTSLHVIDASGGEPVLVGSLELPDEAWGGRLLLDGDRALVLVDQPVYYAVDDVAVSDVAGDVPPGRPGGEYQVPRAMILEVDLSDPAHPAVVGTLSVEGAIVDARQVGSTARIVVRSTPDSLPFVFPSSANPAAEDAAEEVNRTVVDQSTIADWLPDFTLERDGTATQGQLTACEAVHHPEPFAGFATVSVLTVDLAGGLTPGDGTAVIADGQTVYASAENLYVATNQWIDPSVVIDEDTVEQLEEDWTTQIHQFSIAGDAPAAYLASGAVRGTLLNSYSMSEHEGVLRVATTDGSPWSEGTTESGIVVLARDGEQLVPVGQVGGLGRDEQIYAVRYIGATAYVVTFRQTDPLYVVDLSDPSSPTVAGELKINGYSAYLHPVGDGLLLGVGQDADDEGRVVGLQVSLFDVSDPANPQRLQQLVVGDGYSDAEYDPHAFLWWSPTGTAVLPMQVWSYDGAGFETSEPFIGAMGVHVARDTVSEIGRLSHTGRAPETWGDYGPPIMRSLVIGDTLYTLSEAGLGAAGLTSLTESAFVPFPSS